MPAVVDPMTQPIPGRPGSAVRRNDSSSIMRTTASRPTAGVLRPMLLVGVGSFGRKALQQIRARLLDRLGNLNQVPCIRFLCLDSEPEGTPRGAIGSPDVELASDHVLNMPLQQTSNYRRRQLDQVLEWMPKERFYAIPRSLTVDGNRAIGRLAFCDHALRAFTRIKGELQTACHPDSLAASSDFTGLTVLTRTPADSRVRERQRRHGRDADRRRLLHSPGTRQIGRGPAPDHRHSSLPVRRRTSIRPRRNSRTSSPRSSN